MCSLNDNLLVEIQNLQLPLHRIEVGSELAVPLVASIGLDSVQVNLESHLVEEVADRMSMPSSATHLKPRKMSAERCKAENRVGVLLDLFVRNGFLDSNLLTVSSTFNQVFVLDSLGKRIYAHRIISGRKSHEGNSDAQDSVTGGSIAVVGVFGGVTPGYGLHFTIELVQVGDVLYPVVVEVGVFEHGLLVVCDKLLHVGYKNTCCVSNPVKQCETCRVNLLPITRW